MTTAAAASIPTRAIRRLGRWLSVRHTPQAELMLVLGLYGLSEVARGLVAQRKLNAARCRSRHRLDHTRTTQAVPGASRS
jgi:hypothetical protein